MSKNFLECFHNYDGVQQAAKAMNGIMHKSIFNRQQAIRHNLMCVFLNTFQNNNNIFYSLDFYRFRLLSKVFGQEVIVVQLLLMILLFSMVHVEHQQINVILIRTIQFVVRY